MPRCIDAGRRHHLDAELARAGKAAPDHPLLPRGGPVCGRRTAHDQPARCAGRGGAGAMHGARAICRTRGWRTAGAHASVRRLECDAQPGRRRVWPRRGGACGSARGSRHERDPGAVGARPLRHLPRSGAAARPGGATATGRPGPPRMQRPRWTAPEPAAPAKLPSAALVPEPSRHAARAPRTAPGQVELPLGMLGLGVGSCGLLLLAARRVRRSESRSRPAVAHRIASRR